MLRHLRSSAFPARAARSSTTAYPLPRWRGRWAAPFPSMASRLGICHPSMARLTSSRPLSSDSYPNSVPSFRAGRIIWVASRAAVCLPWRSLGASSRTARRLRCSPCLTRTAPTSRGAATGVNGSRPMPRSCAGGPLSRIFAISATRCARNSANGLSAPPAVSTGVWLSWVLQRSTSESRQVPRPGHVDPGHHSAQRRTTILRRPD